MQKKYLLYGIKNLSAIIEYLSHCCDRGINVYINFRGHKIYSCDIKDKDWVYMEVFGLRRSEYDNCISEYKNSSLDEYDMIEEKYNKIRIKNMNVLMQDEEKRRIVLEKYYPDFVKNLDDMKKDQQEAKRIEFEEKEKEVKKYIGILYPEQNDVLLIEQKKLEYDRQNIFENLEDLKRYCNKFEGEGNEGIEIKDALKFFLKMKGSEKFLNIMYPDRMYYPSKIEWKILNTQIFVEEKFEKIELEYLKEKIKSNENQLQENNDKKILRKIVKELQEKETLKAEEDEIEEPF